MSNYMEENKKRWKKQDLLMYTANAYYYFMHWKLYNSESSKHVLGYMKQRIKNMTHLSIKEINEMMYSVDIANEPIKHLYNQFVEWI